MSIQFKSLIITTALCAAIIIGYAFATKPAGELKTGYIDTNRYTTINHSVVSVSSATSTLIAASSTGRGYAAVVNASATPVWVSFGTPAVVGQGVALTQYGMYEINNQKLFVGPIYAITTAGTATVSVINEIQ